LGVPVIVALNMTDVAHRHGLRIDVERLSRQLGMTVVAIQANKGKGLELLKRALVVSQSLSLPFSISGVPFPEAFEREAAALRQALGNGTSSFLVRRLLLD